jgi:hypothetical protein
MRRDGGEHGVRIRQLAAHRLQQFIDDRGSVRLTMVPSTWQPASLNASLLIFTSLKISVTV